MGAKRLPNDTGALASGYASEILVGAMKLRELGNEDMARDAMVLVARANPQLLDWLRRLLKDAAYQGAFGVRPRC